MYLVKTYVDKSPIHGVGSFAGEDIKAGTVIWRWSQLFDTVFHPETQSKVARMPYNWETIKKHCWKEGSSYFYCGDDAKYQNHSETPNTTHYEDFQIACKDIKKGEEITCNYGEFDDDFKAGEKLV